MPIFSVIMPCFNSEKFIEASIQSVLNQTFKDFELIVIDGGSSDNTIKIINKLASTDPRLSLLENIEDQGPAHARYMGINKSKGTYIAFLDADDVWLAGKLAAQIALAKEGANFIATAYVMDKSNRIIKPPTSPNGQLDVFRSLGILTSSIMVSTSLVKQRMFRNLRFSQDIDLWHRISGAKEFSYASLNKPFVMYSTEGSTKNKFTQARSLWKVMTINNISLPRKIYCYVIYAYRGVRNHLLRV